MDERGKFIWSGTDVTRDGARVMSADAYFEKIDQLEELESMRKRRVMDESFQESTQTVTGQQQAK